MSKKYTRHDLAEAPFWDKTRERWLFVDITNCSIFEHEAGISSKFFSFEQMTSNVVATQRGFLVSLENKLVELINEDKFKSVRTVAALDHGSDMRINDGAVGPDGCFYFGTMQKEPTGLYGRLYSIKPSGELLEHSGSVGIPNTFIWLDDKYILISDSYIQKTFKVELLQSGKLDWDNRVLWKDFSHTEATPDGGTIDLDGNVWLAIWGGAVIHKYSSGGKLLDEIELSALQPTACAFGGSGGNEIFITTAVEGLTSSEIDKYPNSGKVLKLTTNTRGKALPSFNVGV